MASPGMQSHNGSANSSSPTAAHTTARPSGLCQDRPAPQSPRRGLRLHDRPGHAGCDAARCSFDRTVQVSGESAATTVDLPALGLPQVFSPEQAAAILRELGLGGMTENALRTRAYRRQVPFHLNGRRITFTVSDLREIAEGDTCRPRPRAEADTAAHALPSVRRRRSPARSSDGAKTGHWRARQPVTCRSVPGETHADRG